MKSLKEKIEVMQAAEDGKEVEVYLSAENGWIKGYDVPNFVWNWDKFDYRIKPEPMEFWVNIYSDFRPCLHEAEDKAKVASDEGICKTIKVREVIE